MGAGRPVDPSGEAWQPAADGGHSAGPERHLLRALDGCQWKALPKDLPPRSTVWEYLDLWDWGGTLGRIHHALYVEVREGGSGGEPDNGDHRQPDREGRRQSLPLPGARPDWSRP